MTLCVMWIRKTSETEELFVATDSILTGGEKWEHGIKLFELPRKDCFICFAGNTERAYPLIFNLISLLKNDSRIHHTERDISELVQEIAILFTDLVKQIDFSGLSDGGKSEDRGGARFLFGGWSWRNNKFKVWHLSYSKKKQRFVEKAAISRLKSYAFIVDVEEASTQSVHDLLKQRLVDGRLNMEPLSVLIEIIKDSDVQSIGGSPQIARIKKSGQCEILGIQWMGTPHVLGKKYYAYQKPRVRYIDPETADIIEDEVPEQLTNDIIDSLDQNQRDFVKKYYSDGKLQDTITATTRSQIHAILGEKAYELFLKTQQEMATQDNQIERETDE